MIDVLMLTAGYASPLVLLAVAVMVADWIHDRRQARNRAQIAPQGPMREATVRNVDPLPRQEEPRGTITAGQPIRVRVIPASEPLPVAYGVAPNREDQPSRHRQDRAA